MQVQRRGAAAGGEHLPVLLGAEPAAGALQGGLQLLVAAQAVTDDFDQAGGLQFAVHGVGVSRTSVMLTRMAFSARYRDSMCSIASSMNCGISCSQSTVRTSRSVASSRWRSFSPYWMVGSAPTARRLGVGEPAAFNQRFQAQVGCDLGRFDVEFQRADEDVDGLVGRAQEDCPVQAGDFLEEFEVEVVADVAAVVGGQAVHRAEAAVGRSDVEQVLKHPPGDLGVLGVVTAGYLPSCIPGQIGHDLFGSGAGVEVHRQGHQVDGVQRQLAHLVVGETAVCTCPLRLSRSCRGAVQASAFTRWANPTSPAIRNTAGAE